MTEQELLIDCLRRLNRTRIAHMLTGSMVSNYWGVPRTTHDLDFVVQLPPSAIPALVKEFSGEFHIDEAAIRNAYQPPHQFNALDTRSALKVDFWLLQPAPFEREMFARKLRVVLFGETAWVCTAEDVVLHKLYWNKLTPSERQLNDSAGVVAVQTDGLDKVYLRKWAKELNVSATLEDFAQRQVASQTNVAKSSASCATTRCPVWMRLNVPPKMPIFIAGDAALFPF